MRRTRTYRPKTLWIIAGLVGLLVILAILQYTWLKKLSEDERQRLQASAEVSAAHFGEDFEREMARPLTFFLPNPTAPDEDPVQALIEKYRRWRSEARYPTLIGGAYVVERTRENTLVVRRVEGEGLSEGHRPWPRGLEAHREAIGQGEVIFALLGDLPGFLVPLAPFPFMPPAGDTLPTVRGYAVIELNIEFISKSFIPELVDRYFGIAKGLDLDVTILNGAHPQEVVYTTSQLPRDGPPPPKVTERLLFSLRNIPELGERDEGRPGSVGFPYGQGPPSPPNLPAFARLFPPLFPLPSAQLAGEWRIVVTHPDGSLEEAVRRMHVRQLAIGLSVLLLLGVSGVLVIVSGHRAQILARQQMEFVAGVSHELCTPLTAIRSAGQNLADGIISDPQTVKSYGSLVEREGRRLSEMLTGVMAFAGIASGQRVYTRKCVSVSAVIDEVLADCKRALDERGFTVETQIEEVEVDADPSALRRALQNLIDNAIKYAGSERWIGVGAKKLLGEGGSEIVITVTDRGIGIPKKDLPHIYDPFYRSEAVAAGGTPGSGLGLNVVRHIIEGHGGRIVVESTPGRGTSFALHLPESTTAAGLTGGSA
ncbi:MAG: hypothetical protein HYX75_16940 [Acidobacteria bacterium]|nr:hypothetical protein [Acidobacteriota bacterium]